MKRSEAAYILGKLISPAYTNKEELITIIQTLKENWEDVIYIANHHLLIPALYHALVQKELFHILDDTMLQDYLYEVYTRNTAHNKHIVSQLQEITILLKSLNITPLLLKGAAALSENHYDDIGVRIMLDIDIVVPEEKIFKSIELLKENGYSEIDPDAPMGKHWHHYRRLYTTNGATSLELHRYIISNKSLKYTLDFQKKTYITPATTIENGSVLHPTYEFFYTFLHSEISHGQHHNLIVSLRHLHHGAVIYHKYKADIDTKEIQHYISTYKLEKVWHEYLYLLEKIFHIKTTFCVPAMHTYEAKIKRNFDKEGTTRWYIERFFQKSYEAFSYTRLKQEYNTLNAPYQLLYFLPKRFFTLSYKILTNKRKRKNIIKAIKTAL